MQRFFDLKLPKTREEGIEKTEYKMTDTYSITKSFLDNPERMIHLLFDE